MFRIDEFELDPDHTLSKGNMIALLARHPGIVTAFDSSLYRRDATLFGDLHWEVNAPSGRQSLKGDGDGDYGTHTAIAFGTEHTLACWLIESDQRGIIWGGSTDQNTGIYPYPNTSIWLYMAQGSQVSFAYSHVAGTLRHAAITRSGTSVELWLDGVSQGTQTLGANNTLTLTNIVGATTERWWNSYAFDFVGWTRILSHSEIKILANRFDPLYDNWIVPVVQREYFAFSANPLAVTEDTLQNISPFTQDESVGTCAATGGTAPYAWEIISQTLL